MQALLLAKQQKEAASALESQLSEQEEMHRKATSAGAVPEQVSIYLEKHKITSIVNQSVNKILKTRPADPLSSIAS